MNEKTAVFIFITLSTDEIIKVTLVYPVNLVNDVNHVNYVNYVYRVYSVYYKKRNSWIIPFYPCLM